LAPSMYSAILFDGAVICFSTKRCRPGFFAQRKR
jgi:hypothetical protein